MSECWLPAPMRMLFKAHSRPWRLCRLPEEEARFYVAEVVAALDHLHGLAIAYRDLKARLRTPLGAVRGSTLAPVPSLQS